jgi:hypothetical protein
VPCPTRQGRFTKRRRGEEERRKKIHHRDTEKKMEENTILFASTSLCEYSLLDFLPFHEEINSQRRHGAENQEELLLRVSVSLW